MHQLGPRLKRYRQMAGMRQEDLAQKAGLSRGYITHVEGGRREPTLESLQKIVGALGINLNVLFGDSTYDSTQGVDNLRRVPIVGAVSAGKPKDTSDMSEITDYATFVTDAKNVIAVTVDGTSLNRVIPMGSIALIDLDDVDPLPGRMYMINTAEGATLKRFTNTGGMMRFEAHSTDPEHSDTYLNQPIEVIGRVISAQQRFDR